MRLAKYNNKTPQAYVSKVKVPIVKLTSCPGKVCVTRLRKYVINMFVHWYSVIL